MRVLFVYWNPSCELFPPAPIGLSYVATATRQAGHEVRFLDLINDSDKIQTLVRNARDFDPHVVGFSVRNIDNVLRQRTEGYLGELAEAIAALRRDSLAKIVLGGPAVSVLGPEILARLDADFVILGEGETAFPGLLVALEGASPSDALPGLCRREEDRIVSNPVALLSSFGASGLENWIDWPAYERRGATWPIQTKRGCPFRCSYCCYGIIEGAASRCRPAGEVADEIERVRSRLAPRTFEFVDSTFNIPEDHALSVCEEIVRRGLGLQLTTIGVNPLCTSRELFDLMRQAGFNSMMITPEAASETMLSNLQKGFTLADIGRTVRLARESGIPSSWFFLLGGPGETQQTVEETMSFIERQLDWDRCLVIISTGVRILPGTELASRSVEEGYLSAEEDLFKPVFYLSPLVGEAWILDRINQAVARRPNIVHAAENGGSIVQRLLERSLYTLGVAPPYSRFLPMYLRFPPLSFLRRRFPAFPARDEARSPRLDSSPTAIGKTRLAGEELAGSKRQPRRDAVRDPRLG